MVIMDREPALTLTQTLLENIKDFKWPITCTVRGPDFEVGQQFLITGGDKDTIGVVSLLDKDGKEIRKFDPGKHTLKIEITEPIVLRIQFMFDNNSGDAEFSFIFSNQDPTLFAYRFFEGEDTSCDDDDEKASSELEGVRTSNMMLFTRRHADGGSMGTGGP